MLKKLTRGSQRSLCPPCLCGCILAVAVALIVAAKPQAAEPVDFAHEIAPLLKDRCGACHTRGRHEGGISFNTREELLQTGAAVPGKSGKSPLIERVSSDDPDLRMPPQGEPLTAEQIALLTQWIDQGANWTEGFSFAEKSYVAGLAPRRPELPAAEPGRERPVDRALKSYDEKHGLTPADRPLVEDHVFIRRVSLDLLGLLPTPEEVDAFLADTDPAKREKLIDRLLADDRAYAEHWLSFWNDLLRNAYTGTGFIDGGRTRITDWLFRSLMANKPYDQFVRELLSPTPESAGFVNGFKWRGNVNASQSRPLQFSQNVSQVMLGINMKCASCHDSFIDDWTLKDAWGLAAIASDDPLEIHRCDKPTGKVATPGFVFPELGTIDPSAPRDQRLKQLAGLMTAPENGRLSRTMVNRLWQRMMGWGITHPVDVMGGEPFSADLLDYLASDFAEHGYDLKHTLKRIAMSRAYQAQAVAYGVDSGKPFVFRGPLIKRMTAEQFLDAVWRVTGTAPSKPAANFGNRGDEPLRASLVTADLLQRSLGRPNREQVVSTRPTELSTLQALDLSNGEILATTLSRGAGHLLRDASFAGQDVAGKVAWVYRHALGRAPTAEETEVAAGLVGEPATQEGLADLLWAVFMLPEFQMIH